MKIIYYRNAFSRAALYIKNFSLQKVFSNIVKAVLFIFCAVPGAFITFFSIIVLLSSMSGGERSASNYFYSAPAIVVGGFLVVSGLGKIKRPLYLLVIWSIPLLVMIPVVFIEILPADLADRIAVTV